MKTKGEWMPAKVVKCRTLNIYDDLEKSKVIFSVDGGEEVMINPSIGSAKMVALKHGRFRGYSDKVYLKGNPI